VVAVSAEAIAFLKKFKKTSNKVSTQAKDHW
jgi:hypothetical protein